MRILSMIRKVHIDLYQLRREHVTEREREREQLEQISLIKVSMLKPKYFSIR